jgi:GNAT superfamily N-acetyltransferase
VEGRYNIRLATEADIDTLVAFTIRQAHEAEGATLTIEEVTAGVRGGFASPPASTYWVAEDAEGTIVANTSVVKEWSDFHGGYYWWIQSVFVVPEQRGSGLLEQLIAFLAGAARTAGALQLRLYVHRSNERATRAYRRCGFVEVPYVIMTLPTEVGGVGEGT